VPSGEPRRYQKHDGYVELRWRVSPTLALCTYEHRVRGGRVTTAPIVHHANEDRSDNDPRNLIPCSHAEHRAQHATYRAGAFCIYNPDGLCRCGCGLPVSLASRTDYARGWHKGRPVSVRHGHVDRIVERD